MTIKIIKPLIAFAALAALLTGCAPQYNPPDYTKYFWPNPPEKKRIQLLNIIKSDLDIRKPSTSEALFGGVAYFDFTKPNGVVADDNGNVFVSDSYDSTIYVFNMEKGSVNTFGPARRWAEPKNMAIDSKNKLIGLIDRTTPLALSLISAKPAIPLKSENFIKPSGIAFDSRNKLIYVSDIRAHKVFQFNFKGKLIKTIGGRGTSPGKFYFPAAMTVDHKGQLFVVDTMNWRIQAFDHEGNFLRTFGSHGSEPGMFGRPKGIAVSKDGVLMVVDADFNRVTLFTEKGQVLLLFGSTGNAPMQFLNPKGIYVDNKDRIYVTDQSNRRVQAFQLLTDQYYENEFKKKVTPTPPAATSPEPTATPPPKPQ